MVFHWSLSDSKSPGFFSVFWLILVMLYFRWSHLVLRGHQFCQLTFQAFEKCSECSNYFTRVITGGFHWSLEDRKYPLISRTILSILVDFCSAVFWPISTFWFQVPQPLFQVFREWFKVLNYDWYYCYFRVPQVLNSLMRSGSLVFLLFRDLLELPSQLTKKKKKIWDWFMFYISVCWESFTIIREKASLLWSTRFFSVFRLIWIWYRRLWFFDWLPVLGSFWVHQLLLVLLWHLRSIVFSVLTSCYCCNYSYFLRVFHISVSWKTYIEVWVTLSLQGSSQYSGWFQ